MKLYTDARGTTPSILVKSKIASLSEIFVNNFYKLLQILIKK